MAAGLLAGLAAAAPGAHAQPAANWPAKPVKIIVNYPPGGSTDNGTRPFAEFLSRNVGQPVVIDNRGGASGQVGVEAGVKSAPDGYTFIVTPVASVTILPQARKVAYDPFKDMVPVSHFADSTFVIAVHPSVKATTLKELEALAKPQPGKLNFGSSGLGTMTQMVCEGLNQAAGIEILHVPYRGGAESLSDFLAGVTQVFSEGNILPHVKAGKARLLAIVDTKRHPDFPDVPLASETYPSMDMLNWFGMFAPAGTPDAIVRRMSDELNKASRDPDLQAHMLKLALRANVSSPEDLAAQLRKDYDRYGKMVRDLKIRLD
jgi:tripartite-type tricarboxylate transporter receptor subunit TctC